jgi:hypothetical protein
MERWRAVHDLCHLHAVEQAFEDTQLPKIATMGTDGYEHSCLMNLVDITRWVVRFCERLLKEIIVFEARENWDESLSTDQKEKEKHWNAPSPVLITLLHPYALSLLRNVMNHVEKLKHFLMALIGAKSKPSMELAYRDLEGLVDHSPVDIRKLHKALSEIVPFSPKKGQDSAEMQRQLHAMLITLIIPIQLSPSLKTAVQSILAHPDIVDRTVLMIRELDIADSSSLFSNGINENQLPRDIISMGTLTPQFGTRICLRCGEKANILWSNAEDEARRNQKALPLNTRWKVFESCWEKHCICGGAWSRVL